MPNNVTLKKVIDVVKISAFINWCYPLSKDAIKLKVVCVKLYQYFCIIVTLSVTLGLANTVRIHADDPIIVAKSIIVMCPTVHIICNIVCCQIYSHRLQYVTFEMENFCESLESHEIPIVQHYIDKCVYFYSGIIISFYMSAVLLILGPATLDQPFPTLAEYPFDVYHQPQRSLTYICQSFVLLQASSQICLSILMSLLIWSTSAKFKVLAEELQAIDDICDLIRCIQKHQKLLKYAEDVALVVRPFAFINVCMSTIALIIAGLIFITGQPLPMKVQCIGLILTGLSEVFIFTWPAEYLIYISSEVGQAVFNMQWYKQPVDLQKNVQTILLRAQKPIFIAIPCVMPPLSLHYFTTYLSTIFSYFTTLRIVMQEDHKNEESN